MGAALVTPARALSLTDLGARPGEGDAGPAFAAALARLPRQGGAVLRIPPGVWRFGQTSGIAVDVNGFDGLTIEGEGARLLFAGHTRPFVFTACRAPTLRGVAIDWERPPFSQGEVIATGALWAEIRIDAGFPVDGSEGVPALATYDRAAGLVARGGVDAYDVVAGVALAGAQRLRLSFGRAIPLRAGDTVVLRHALYAASAVAFIRCQDLAVDGVTLHTAPGMGVFADHCSGAAIRGLLVVPPDGGGRLMTLTADAVHFSACNGAIVVEDCIFAGMGDDGVNIHGKYFRIAARPDARTALVAAAPGAIAGPLHQAADGDHVEIVAAATLQASGEGRVATAEPAPGGQTRLRFTADLDAAAGDYLFDAETRSQARVSRCRLPGNRARGVLAHSDAIIEGCTFAGQSAEAILLLPDTRFMEGPAAERVTIRGNTISDSQRLGSQAGAVRIGVGGALPGGPVNRGITVAGNHFADLAGPALRVQSSAQVLIERNRIDHAGDPVIVLDSVVDVRIVGNSCAPGGRVGMSEADRLRVVMSGNFGLS